MQTDVRRQMHISPIILSAILLHGIHPKRGETPMNSPYHHCVEYCFVGVDEINEYLPQGFEPFGNVIYHVKHQRCYQALIKYAFRRLPPLPVLTPREQDSVC